MKKDRFSASKRRLESQITTLFAGRLAEAIIFGDDALTTGAQNDIERATAIAQDMVTKWGLTEGLGPLAYQYPEGEVFLGQSVTQCKQFSDVTARQRARSTRKCGPSWSETMNVLASCSPTIWIDFMRCRTP